jgi:hypothetical protein
MKHESTTCDNCGITKGAAFSGPDPVSPYVWFTISQVGRFEPGEPIPRMSMGTPGRPDLCSWKCVAEFGQKYAEKAVTDIAADAARAAAPRLAP